jgi:hypothetical protein
MEHIDAGTTPVMALFCSLKVVSVAGKLLGTVPVLFELLKSKIVRVDNDAIQDGMGAGANDFIRRIVKCLRFDRDPRFGIVPVNLEPDKCSTERLAIEAMFEGIEPVALGADIFKFVNVLRVPIDDGKDATAGKDEGRFTPMSLFWASHLKYCDPHTWGFEFTPPEHPQLISHILNAVHKSHTASPVLNKQIN